MNHASYFGHSFTVVTDHAKARPWLEDLVRIHGAGNCRGVRCIDWYVTDMIEDTTAVADDAAAACLQALQDDQAEVVILGCTIIGGCLEREIMTTGRHRDLPILNPNLLALKAAETLADLHRMGKYTISRVGLYQRHEQHDPVEAAEVRRRWHLADRGAGEAGPVTTVRSSRSPISPPASLATTSVSSRANGSRSSSTTGPTGRSRPSSPGPPLELGARPGRGVVRAQDPERRRAARLSRGCDGRRGRRRVRRQHVPVSHSGQGGGTAGRCTRRLQRPVPRRGVADRRHDRGLRGHPGAGPSDWLRSCG